MDLLITHHDAWPFLFGMKEACLRILEDADIAHFFIHLPLDDADFGTSASLVNCLGGHIIDRTDLYMEQFYCGRTVEFQPSIPFAEVGAASGERPGRNREVLAAS